MPIEMINTNICEGCGRCVTVCPGDVIRIDEDKKVAFIVYPEECMGCGFCSFECPKGAIEASPLPSSMPLVSWV